MRRLDAVALARAALVLRRQQARGDAREGVHEALPPRRRAAQKGLRVARHEVVERRDEVREVVVGPLVEGVDEHLEEGPEGRREGRVAVVGQVGQHLDAVLEVLHEVAVLPEDLRQGPDEVGLDGAVDVARVVVQSAQQRRHGLDALGRGHGRLVVVVRVRRVVGERVRELRRERDGVGRDGVAELVDDDLESLHHVVAAHVGHDAEARLEDVRQLRLEQTLDDRVLVRQQLAQRRRGLDAHGQRRVLERAQHGAAALLDARGGQRFRVVRETHDDPDGPAPQEAETAAVRRRAGHGDDLREHVDLQEAVDGGGQRLAGLQILAQRAERAQRAVFGARPVQGHGRGR